MATGRKIPGLGWQVNEKLAVTLAALGELLAHCERHGWNRWSAAVANALGTLEAVRDECRTLSCTVCGKDFLVGGGREWGNRRDRKTCSNACRVKAHRLRKKAKP